MANCSSPHRLMPSSPRHHRPEIHAAHLSGVIMIVRVKALRALAGYLFTGHHLALFALSLFLITFASSAVSQSDDGSGNQPIHLQPRLHRPQAMSSSPTTTSDKLLSLVADMNQSDSRINFHSRSDGLWQSYKDQPNLLYGSKNVNLNVGQSGYTNPWD